MSGRGHLWFGHGADRPWPNTVNAMYEFTLSAGLRFGDFAYVDCSREKIPPDQFCRGAVLVMASPSPNFLKQICALSLVTPGRGQALHMIFCNEMFPIAL